MITLNVESLNLEAVEAVAIRAALELHKNNKTQAALELGCDRRSLYRKMERLGLLPVKPSSGEAVVAGCLMNSNGYEYIVETVTNK